MKSVKFIHGADLHLDSPMVGLQSLPPNIFKRLKESTFKAFSCLIDAAIRNRVDFVILAGDLYDHEDRSIKAQVFLRKEMERLAEEGIDAYLIHGNHDHLSGNWNVINYPSNVHVFDDVVTVKKMETKNSTIVHLYGFSYPERHVLERKIVDYQRQSGADFHIGILHGNIEGSKEHGNYAPFQIKELLEKDFDYWALGHIHKREILNEQPPIIYPGNIQGRNRKEKEIKGCYFVSLHETGPQLEFIETSDIIWMDLMIDATLASTFDALYQICREQMEHIRREGIGVLANFYVINYRSEEIGSSNMEELLEIIQEEEKDQESFVWPVRIHAEEKLFWKREELSQESDFYGELFKVIDDFGESEEAIASLYKHHSARKYLSALSVSELDEIRKEAEILLMEGLIRKR